MSMAECPNLWCRWRGRWGEAHECVILPIGLVKRVRFMVDQRMTTAEIARRTGLPQHIIARLRRPAA